MSWNENYFDCIKKTNPDKHKSRINGIDIRILLLQEVSNSFIHTIICDKINQSTKMGYWYKGEWIYQLYRIKSPKIMPEVMKYIPNNL